MPRTLIGVQASFAEPHNWLVFFVCQYVAIRERVANWSHHQIAIESCSKEARHASTQSICEFASATYRWIYGKCSIPDEVRSICAALRKNPNRTLQVVLCGLVHRRVNRVTPSLFFSLVKIQWHASLDFEQYLDIGSNDLGAMNAC